MREEIAGLASSQSHDVPLPAQCDGQLSWQQALRDVAVVDDRDEQPAPTAVGGGPNAGDFQPSRDVPRHANEDEYPEPGPDRHGGMPRRERREQDEGVVVTWAGVRRGSCADSDDAASPRRQHEPSRPNGEPRARRSPRGRARCDHGVPRDVEGEGGALRHDADSRRSLVADDERLGFPPDEGQMRGRRREGDHRPGRRRRRRAGSRGSRHEGDCRDRREERTSHRPTTVYVSVAEWRPACTTGNGSKKPRSVGQTSP